MSLLARGLAHSNKTVILQNRDIEPPLFGSSNFDETFSGDSDPLPAIVKTPRGKTFFDGVGTDVNITHEIVIAFIEGVSAETWVLFKGRRIDILEVENCCEDDEVLILTCTDRGTGEAAKA